MGELPGVMVISHILIEFGSYKCMYLSKFRERWTHGLSLSFAVTSPQIDKYQTLHNDIPVKMFSDDMY